MIFSWNDMIFCWLLISKIRSNSIEFYFSNVFQLNNGLTLLTLTVAINWQRIIICERVVRNIRNTERTLTFYFSPSYICAMCLKETTVYQAYGVSVWCDSSLSTTNVNRAYSLFHKSENEKQQVGLSNWTYTLEEATNLYGNCFDWNMNELGNCDGMYVVRKIISYVL